MTARDDEPAPLADSARRIVDAARPFERLPPERKARVRGRVLAAVAAGAAVTAAAGAVQGGAGGTAAAGTSLGAGAVEVAGLSLLTKIGLSVALVTVGLGGWMWSRANSPPPPATVHIAPATPLAPSAEPAASPEPASPEPTPLPNTAYPDSAPPAAARSSSPVPAADRPSPTATPTSSSTAAPVDAPSADSLQEETRLLAAAHAALSRGDAAGALALLDEHATRFPRGALAPERRAARAMALCKQGRSADGQREADALYGEGNKSPVAEKIRRACAK